MEKYKSKFKNKSKKETTSYNNSTINFDFSEIRVKNNFGF
jgi:hypothetical protein